MIRRNHLVAALLLAACSSGPQSQIEVRTAMKYDLAYALYPLAGCSSGTNSYRARHPEFWSRFGPGIPASLQPALDQIRAIKEQQGFLFAANLARLFARIDGETISSISAHIEADDPEVTAEVESWGTGFGEAWRGEWKAGTLGYLRYLEAAGFESWWATQIQPTLEAKARVIVESGIQSLSVDREIERWSGHAAKGGSIVLYPVYFSAWQGQQIMFAGKPGLIYLADSSWDAGFDKLQLVHEVSHNQLLDWSNPDVQALVPVFQADPWFEGIFEGQVIASGYSNIASFVEENVTEGAQMIMAPALGIPVDAKAYLRTHDGGSHVLSAAMLTLISDQSWKPGGGEPFQSFFLRMAAEGRFAPGQIRPLYDRFFRE
ncbi:MAG: hypothetical protein ACXWLR_15460 [Myxococcales bacterium]